MSPPALLAELLLRGLAIGAVAAVAIGLLHGGAGRATRVAGPLFCLGVIAYTLGSSPALAGMLGVLDVPVTLLSLGGGGFFWLFVYVLFEDHPVDLRSLAPALGLTALGLLGLRIAPPANAAVWILHNLVEIGLAAHALRLIQRSWRGDLVEARRRLRGPFMAAVAVYAIVLAGIEIGERLGVHAAWYGLASALTLALLGLGGGAMFLQARAALFGAAQPPAPAPSPASAAAAADRLDLERLAQAMQRDAVWKDETLSIGRLAGLLGIPEHRLRRLINDRLGHRNFAAFVNGHRIAAAQQALADPARARSTVAAIAFEHGFNSIGPFNRAFREVTGRTPTEWRRDALGGSPNPENPG